MIQWVAADLRTGVLQASLPSLDVDWPLRRSLNNFDTATATLNVGTEAAPVGWDQIIRPRATLLACYDDADGLAPRHAIIWAGYVNARTRTGAADTAALNLVTIEGYFDCRYVEDQSYTSGWRAIAADLIGKYVAETADDPGLQQITVAYDGDGAAPSSPLVMQNTDNATVFGRLTDLMTQFGGEFTVDWGWSDEGLRLVPTLRLADRIGSQTLAVTFTIPGPITDVTVTEDSSSGKGANKVTAWATTADSGYTAYGTPARAADFNGEPTFEYRIEADSSQISDAGLLAAAGQVLPFMKDGARTVDMTISTDPTAVQGRRLGVDWGIGDTVGYRIGGLNSAGKETMPPFPGGITGTARVVAVEIYESTVKPIFADSSSFPDVTG